VYDYVKTKFGSQRSFELLSQRDNEGYGPLEWAADAGDVNIIEFLLRRGLDPFSVDRAGRGPLHWAVKSHRVAAARFLVLCGVSPQTQVVIPCAI